MPFAVSFRVKHLGNSGNLEPHLKCLNSRVNPLCRARLDNWYHTFTFTFMHLADAFIQSDLQCIQVIFFFASTYRSTSQEYTCGINNIILHFRSIILFLAMGHLVFDKIIKYNNNKIFTIKIFKYSS